MANTYTLIQAQTLASSAASVTFSSIPATYTDLVLRISTRSNVVDFRDNDMIYFNGSGATTNYSFTYIRSLPGLTPSAGSGRASSTSSGQGLQSNGDSSTANTFSSGEIYIPNYLVSANKPFSFVNYSENNTANDARLGATANLFSNTTAISSITMLPQTGPSYMAGSSFYLYGIKNS